MKKLSVEFVKSLRKIASQISIIATNLGVIETDLRSVREKVVDNANQPSPSDDTGNTNTNHTASSNTAISDQKQDEGGEKAKGSFNRLWDNLKRDIAEPRAIVEAFTLGFLIFYVCETRRTNNLTQNQFALQHQPYLWHEASIDAVGSTNRSNTAFGWGGKEGSAVMTVRLKIQNFGQSPAIVTRFTGDVRGGGAGDYLHKLSAHTWKKYQSIMPPGRVDIFAVDSKEVVPPNATIIPEPKGSVGALLRIQYTDTEGHPFESDICVFTPAGIVQILDYCPADLQLNRLIDCQKERCEE